LLSCLSEIFSLKGTKYASCRVAGWIRLSRKILSSQPRNARSSTKQNGLRWKYWRTRFYDPLRRRANLLRKGIPAIGPVKRRQPSGILSAQDSAQLSRQKVALVSAMCPRGCDLTMLPQRKAISTQEKKIFLFF
jgi:hypothetical protein